MSGDRPAPEPADAGPEAGFGDRDAGQRAVPYVCPFCGEETLRPAERGWHCRSCLRVFSVTFHGIAPPQIAAPQIAAPGSRSTAP